MKRSLREELEGFDGSYPETLMMKPGDIFVGEVIRYDEAPTRFGVAPILVVADEQSGALYSLWLLATVLRNEVQKQRPRIGERIGVKRLPDSEKGYQKWVLRVEREPEDGADGGGVPDFAKYGPAADVLPDEPHPAVAAPAPPADSDFQMGARAGARTPADADREAAIVTLREAVRAAGGTTIALAKNVLSAHLPISDFTTPEGAIDYARLGTDQMYRVAESIREQNARVAASDEIPF